MPASHASPQETTERAGKRRAPMSCDRCKSRKTKCVDPVPGPCQFCASIGAVCHLDPSRRRQRPYYHVSEEEFRYMTKALEHFLPNVDLNLQSLKEVVRTFDSGGLLMPVAPPPPQPAAAASSSSEPGDSIVVKDSHLTPTPPPSNSDAGSAGDTSVVTIEEIDELHGELGWLRVDSRGTYRHVGADSGYGFNAAVRSLKQRRTSEASKSELVAPCTAAPPLPPATPESSMGLGMGVGVGVSPAAHQIILPRRDLCNRCVSRFFGDIQSIYWFFSAERFYTTLDRIYAGDPTSATPSMLCSLYSILALTSESEAQVERLDSGCTPAGKYLSLAKGLVPTLYDEADVDSIRALCLLGLALQSSMFSNTAYIYIGSAARIAFTLGLHLEKTIESRGCLQRQVDLRVFSTLYLLDLDVALCYGNPAALNEDNTSGRLMDLSELILSPGSNMPLDYLAVSCKLAHLKRRLTKLLYSKPANSASAASTTTTTTTSAVAAASPGTPGGSSSNNASSKPAARSISTVADELAALRAWHASIPPHLRDPAQAASYHQRSVAVLHLRYWSATVFATRPFLLYSVVHAAELASSRFGAAKRASFGALGEQCIKAAAQSLAVLLYMLEAGLLSSLVTLDTACVLEDLQVFLLAVARGQQSRADDVRACLRVLQGMEPVFWTRHALTEVMAQLDENGLLNDNNGFSPPGAGETPGHFFLDIGQQHELGPGMMDSYLPDLQDPFFAMADRATPMMSGPSFQEGIVQGSEAITL